MHRRSENAVCFLTPARIVFIFRTHCQIRKPRIFGRNFPLYQSQLSIIIKEIDRVSQNCFAFRKQDLRSGEKANLVQFSARIGEVNLPSHFPAVKTFMTRSGQRVIQSFATRHSRRQEMFITIYTLAETEQTRFLFASKKNIRAWSLGPRLPLAHSFAAGRNDIGFLLKSDGVLD